MTKKELISELNRAHLFVHRPSSRRPRWEDSYVFLDMFLAAVIGFKNPRKAIAEVYRDYDPMRKKKVEVL